MAYLRNLARPLLWKHLPASIIPVQCSQPVTTASRLKAEENFWNKNSRLMRPLSPHLTIYKFQITWVLSITHRMTGLILSGGVYGLSIGMLALPANFPYYVNYLQSVHIASPLIYTLKFALAWAFFFHTANGIRHLAWDLGYGYELKDLNMTGYLVLGSSVALAAITAAM